MKQKRNRALLITVVILLAALPLLYVAARADSGDPVLKVPTRTPTPEPPRTAPTATAPVSPLPSPTPHDSPLPVPTMVPPDVSIIHGASDAAPEPAQEAVPVLLPESGGVK